LSSVLQQDVAIRQLQGELAEQKNLVKTQSVVIKKLKGK